ncbi:PREDICTED: nucleoside diphosphate kinase, mitochondrial [Ficedula albicollis]|uniref:nucleoside diphosphate kinase, mitochondrial n=1 Tax=Ficedula albicollis TaxID=59894 RepID=UPI000359AB20|nr:PREDICTED: nucleoside diphosphate kinase, mitochondrial [Ficedula albicollis]
MGSLGRCLARSVPRGQPGLSPPGPRCYGSAPPALQEQTLLVAKPDALRRRPPVWEGYNVVRCTRAMVGDSGAVGTIRGDLSVHIARNLVHASDSVETARREIGFWFQRHELLAWDSGDRDNIYGL